MKAFLFLLLVALVIGEVSGGLQVGVPTGEAAQPNQNQNGQLIFAAIIAIALIIVVILIQEHAR